MQEADAFDVCQEVAAAISRSLANYRRTQSSFRAWLKVITSRKISDHFRLRQKEPDAMGGSDAHEQLQNFPTECLSGDADSEAEEENILYRQALNLLQQEFEENTWRAFWKVVIEGRAPIDVADEIGISTNAVYLARSHILRRLRREFSDIGPPFGNVTRLHPPSDAS
jgi:RNA polymerase sigma-70 factor (ECF subfamily)